MLTNQEFDALKQEFLQNNQEYTEEIRKLTVEDLQEIGTKGRLSAVRLKAVMSYQKLLSVMLTIPVRIGFPYRVLDTDWESDFFDKS